MPLSPNYAAERQARIARVSEMYLSGQSMRDIAGVVKVSLATVFHDLRAAHENWKSRSADARGKWIERELSTLDWVELEATRAWLRSIGKIKTTKKENGVGAQGIIDKTSETTEHQAGDPRFLETVRGCVADRRKLLGLDAPEKLNLTANIPETMPDSDLEKAILQTASTLATGILIPVNGNGNGHKN